MKIVDKERFITCLLVLMILIGLHIAICTIEHNQKRQIEAVSTQATIIDTRLMMAGGVPAETDDPDSGEVAGTRYELAVQCWPLHRLFIENQIHKKGMSN